MGSTPVRESATFKNMNREQRIELESIKNVSDATYNIRMEALRKNVHCMTKYKRPSKPVQ